MSGEMGSIWDSANHVADCNCLGCFRALRARAKKAEESSRTWMLRHDEVNTWRNETYEKLQTAEARVAVLEGALREVRDGLFRLHGQDLFRIIDAALSPAPLTAEGLKRALAPVTCEAHRVAFCADCPEPDPPARTKCPECGTTVGYCSCGPAPPVTCARGIHSHGGCDCPSDFLLAPPAEDADLRGLLSEAVEYLAAESDIHAGAEEGYRDFLTRARAALGKEAGDV